MPRTWDRLLARSAMPRRGLKYRRGGLPRESKIFSGARILGLYILANVQALTCFGQSSQDIVTDRPDITASSIVVPPGKLQGENGVNCTRDHERTTRQLSVSLR